jgi:tRNA-2-methylthio-N6-dimethylallyladenosine synthase
LPIADCRLPIAASRVPHPQVMTQRTVYIETYGCQMNVSDSELMLGKLTADGYVPVDHPDGADVILVNTCAIRDHAEQRVIGRVGELKRSMKPDTVLGVTGCMAQRLARTATVHCRSWWRERGAASGR